MRKYGNKHKKIGAGAGSMLTPTRSSRPKRITPLCSFDESRMLKDLHTRFKSVSAEPTREQMTFGPIQQ